MKPLKQKFLLYGLITCNLMVILIICGVLYQGEIQDDYPLVIFLLIALGFFVYLFVLTIRATSVLLLGDQHSESEKLINFCDTCLLGAQLSSQIVPSVLLEQDSPRGRLQLKRLKGSFFNPPRIVIVLNLQRLLHNNEGEVLLLCSNLNRVLFLLRHINRMQQIDVVFNHLDQLQGYKEFVTQGDSEAEYSAEVSIAQQLSALQNSTKALLTYPPANFMHYLAFTHSIPTVSRIIEKMLNDLLLSDKDAHARVYLRA